MIPVDHVADYCIVTAALQANTKRLNVFHFTDLFKKII